MICDQCRRRFGKIGEDFWNARSGLCPLCKGTKSHASFFITADHKEKLE